MIQESLPELPQRSLTSQGVLYRPLQDIEVYVEDEGSEVFYEEILYRLIDRKHRIVKVFPLRGRENVVSECQNYNDNRPALFIIDGDLTWAAGVPDLSIDRLFTHQCYCIENYLICENAAIEVAFENSGTISRDKIKSKLKWQNIKSQVESYLIDLFSEFAVAHVLHPTLKTTSHGFESVCTQPKKKAVPQFDSNKSKSLAISIKNDVISKVGLTVYQETRTSVYNRISTLPDPLDAVSGKDFLIPLMMFCIKQIVNSNLTRDSFVLRLAKHCALEKLENLKQALIQEITKYQYDTQQAATAVSADAPPLAP
ncbi:DUF4435 domain-containing protein [Geobacter sulfurreducens]|uniref:DUF4435 domain-containing protein n=1 Tax=Geobacter sulfurreducens TaxID=35554 RepID=UPI0001E34244|nr:DUF4435 domain-containing protein [Geobacter sulfurreducens]ADN78373.1 hypothetical protein KN400_3479 [Geobacter sulfurreducens KN400]